MPLLKAADGQQPGDVRVGKVSPKTWLTRLPTHVSHPDGRLLPSAETDPYGGQSRGGLPLETTHAAGRKRAKAKGSIPSYSRFFPERDRSFSKNAGRRTLVRSRGGSPPRKARARLETTARMADPAEHHTHRGPASQCPPQQASPPLLVRRNSCPLDSRGSRRSGRPQSKAAGSATGVCGSTKSNIPTYGSRCSAS